MGQGSKGRRLLAAAIATLVLGCCAGLGTVNAAAPDRATAANFSRPKDLTKKIAHYVRHHSLKQIAGKRSLTHVYVSPSAGELTARVTARVRTPDSATTKKVTVFKGAKRFHGAKRSRIKIRSSARVRKLLRGATRARFAVEARFRASNGQTETAP